MNKNKFSGKKQVMRREKMLDDSYTLLELHQLFITAKKTEGLRERTIADHKLHFKFLSEWLRKANYGLPAASKLTIEVFRSYIEYMQDRGLSPVTINVRLRTLRCFLKFIFEEGYVDINFASKLKLVKTDRDTLRILTDEQVNDLLKVIDKRKYTNFRDYVAIAVMCDCGIRISELGSIKRFMIDFDKLRIHIPLLIPFNYVKRFHVKSLPFHSKKLGFPICFLNKMNNNLKFN